MSRGAIYLLLFIIQLFALCAAQPSLTVQPGSVALTVDAPLDLSPTERFAANLATSALQSSLFQNDFKVYLPSAPTFIQVDLVVEFSLEVEVAASITPCGGSLEVLWHLHVRERLSGRNVVATTLQSTGTGETLATALREAFERVLDSVDYRLFVLTLQGHTRWPPYTRS